MKIVSRCFWISVNKTCQAQFLKKRTLNLGFVQCANLQMVNAPPQKKTPERTENRAKETTTKTVFVTVMEQFDSVCGGFSFVGDSHATDNSSGNVPLPMLIHRLHTELSSLSFVVRINETLCLEFEKNVITVHNSSCGNVMFLQVSVCPQGRGNCTSPGRHPPWAETPRDGHCSGRYASYWNTFLFILFLCHL